MRLFCAVAALLVLAACGERSDFRVDDLEVEQHGWDALSVRASFQAPDPFGRSFAHPPDSARLLLFGGRSDTLYAEALPAEATVATSIEVPDVRLGDREPLLVEVCGHYGSVDVCEQAGVRASPKRVRVAGEPEVTYPEEDDLDRLRLDARYVVERARFEGEGWERLDPVPPVEAELLASIEGHDDDPLRVPLGRSRTGARTLVRLGDHEGYRDFAYRLRSALYEGREAPVQFDLQARLARDVGRDDLAAPEPAVTVLRTIAPKSEADRYAQAQRLARQAVQALLDTFSRDGDYRARYQMGTWRFNPVTRRYEVEVEAAWVGGGFFRRDRHRLRGLASADETGRAARFVLDDARSDTRDLWRETTGGPVLALPDLDLAPDTTQADSLAPAPLPAEARRVRDDDDRERRRHGW